MFKLRAEKNCMRPRTPCFISYIIIIIVINNNSSSSSSSSRITVDNYFLRSLALPQSPARATQGQHELWQVRVVQLGFHHEFLLRGILAASALHLSYLRPQRRESLALRASTHQSLAVQSFRICIEPRRPGPTAKPSLHFPASSSRSPSPHPRAQGCKA
ncbi:hypothetical protein PABG_12361 [Paracoccidioides brasiliensis Pb03]|nr:hypothetical protein PABG_12361 [Paracoccidioides brasiliensis Pb03]